MLVSSASAPARSFTSAASCANCSADSTLREKKMTKRTPRRISASTSEGMLVPSNPMPTIRAASRSSSCMTSMVRCSLQTSTVVLIQGNDQQRQGTRNCEQTGRDKHAFIAEDRLHDSREDGREGDKERPESRANRIMARDKLPALRHVHEEDEIA